MAEPTRRVRELSVRAPDVAAARSVAIRLEDALRTASLPRSRRVLLVRRLDLGRVREGASPQSLSLLLEQRLRDIERHAVRHDSPAAAAADAVWFSDRVAALVEFAEQLGRGTADAWYWPRLVRGYRAGRSPELALRAWLAAVLAGPAPLLALVRSVERLIELEAEAPLLESLTPALAVALLATSNISATDVPPEAPPLDVGAAYRRLLEVWSQAWGRDDPRSLWLAVVAIGRARPELLASSRLGAHARALLLAAGARREAREPGGPTRERARLLDGARPDATLARARAAGASAEPEHPAPPREPGAWVDRAVSRAPAARGAALGLDVEPGASTEFGGLYFVLRVLVELGLEPFLEAHPETDGHDIGRGIVLELASQAGVPEDDPILEPLEPGREREDGKSGRIEFGSASRFPDFLFPESAPDVGDLAWLRGAWARAVERWLEEYTELGVSELVRRPARVVRTRTHVDVFFDHDQADVRVRRAALDVDPGYVPWLGWVFSFHYGQDAA